MEGDIYGAKNKLIISAVIGVAIVIFIFLFALMNNYKQETPEITGLAAGTDELYSPEELNYSETSSSEITSAETSSLPPAAVKTITEEEARRALDSAKEDIDEMNISGFSTEYVSDLYIQAQNAFNGENITKLKERLQSYGTNSTEIADIIAKLAQGSLESGGKIGANYTLVLQLAETINDKKDDAYTIFDNMEMLTLEMEAAVNTTPNINMTEVNELFALAEQEFADERYPEAQAYIDQTYIKIDEAIVESSRMNALLKSSQRNIIYIVTHHYIEIIIILAILAILGYVSFNEGKIKHLKNKITDLDAEKIVIETLLRKNETEYYVTKTISKTMFEIKTTTFKDKLLGIKENKPVLQSNLESARQKRSVYTLGLSKKLRKETNK